MAAAKVFEAIDYVGSYLYPPNEKKVIKVILPITNDQKIRIDREVNALWMMDHPAIPKPDLEDYFEQELPNGLKLQCLAMNKIEGLSLDKWIEQHGSFSQEQVIDFLRQLFEIIQYVHKQGFIHRDIKPDNIIVQPNGRYSLIDFGVAREITSTYYAKISCSTLSLVHTNNYSPPEQLACKAIPQSDFFSLGRTAISATTGLALHEMPIDQKGQILWHQYAKHLDKPLISFLDRLNSPSVNVRPQQAQDALDFLEGGKLNKQIKRSRFLRSKLFISLLSAIILGISLIGVSVFRDWQANSLLIKGVMLAQENKIDASKAAFEHSIKLNPTYDAYSNLGMLCSRENNFDCANKNLRKAIQLQPNRWEAYYNLASHYDDAKNFKEAERYYREAMSNGGRAPEVLNNLARILILRNNLVAAQQYVREGTALAPDAYAKAYFLKNSGWIAYKKGDLALARHQLQASINLYPLQTAPHCLLAQVQESMGQKATQHWENCLNIQGEDALSPEVTQWRKLIINRSLKI
jgi:serine/threonine protein kinase